MSIINRNRTTPFIMWFVTLLFFTCQFVARSSFFSVFTEQFMKHFKLDSNGIGLLVSCYYWVYVMMQIPAGIILDRFSVKVVATAATAISALGVFLLVITSNCYVAGLGQMLSGFGSSFAFITAVKTITNWFPKNKVSIMCSYTLSIGCLGPVFANCLISNLMKKFNWISIITVFVLIELCLSASIWIVMKDKRQAECQKKTPLMSSLKIILTSQQTWMLGLYSLLSYAPVSILGDLWGISFIKSAYGVDPTTAALVNNMIYIGAIAGTPLMAYLAAAINNYKYIMIFGMMLLAACMGIVALYSQLPIEAVFIIFFLIGFFSGGSILSFSLITMKFKKDIVATASGFINMLSMFSGVIFMPLIGYIINLSWNGSVANGINVYSATDFKLGLTSLLLFLVIGIFLSFMINDKEQ